MLLDQPVKEPRGTGEEEQIPAEAHRWQGKPRYISFLAKHFFSPSIWITLLHQRQHTLETFPCVCRDSTATKRVRASPSSVPSCPEADGRSQTSPCCRNEFAAHSVPPTVPAGADRSSAPPEAFESCSETGNYTAPLQHRAHPQVKNLYTRTTREQSAHSKEGRRWEGATHFYEKRMGQGMSNSTSTHQQLRS